MNHSLTIIKRIWLLTAIALIAPMTAWAEGFATVKAIAEPDTRGRWRPVQASAAAAVVEADGRTPLTVGMALELGQRIVTDEARVTLQLARNESITLSPGSDLELQERSAIQRLGEVYYQVRDVFSVQYGTVQTAVEGTEFAISGREGPVQVSVTEGAVRVSNAGESVRVKRGQQVVVGTEQMPPTPSRLSMNAMQSIRGGAWTLGRPKLQLGAIASGGLYGESGGAELRYFAAVRVLPGLNAIADLGQAWTTDSHRHGTGLGLEWTAGGFSVGGTASLTLERWQYACGGNYAALHTGGSAHARFSADITRRLFVTAMGRAAANGDGIEASFGLGGGVSL